MKTEIWKDNFKSASLRVGFRLGLSRAMCEFLSATASGVEWNRAALGGASPDPDNFLATSRSLVIRGLIERKPNAEEEARSRPHKTSFDLWSWTQWRLTPAGEHVVGLLKLCDMFVEADMAMEKKARATTK
jgi:hypothetical protein